MIFLSYDNTNNVPMVWLQFSTWSFYRNFWWFVASTWLVVILACCTTWLWKEILFEGSRLCMKNWKWLISSSTEWLASWLMIWAWRVEFSDPLLNKLNELVWLIPLPVPRLMMMNLFVSSNLWKVPFSVYIF